MPTAAFHNKEHVECDMDPHTRWEARTSSELLCYQFSDTSSEYVAGGSVWY